jgi:hypothetical protein
MKKTKERKFNPLTVDRQKIKLIKKIKKFRSKRSKERQRRNMNEEA